jgi:phage replication-related protein YjqB (UPF0714/DUF867 family)
MWECPRVCNLSRNGAAKDSDVLVTEAKSRVVVLHLRGGVLES